MTQFTTESIRRLFCYPDKKHDAKGIGQGLDCSDILYFSASNAMSMNEIGHADFVSSLKIYVRSHRI